jgi:hypothetical protein
MRQSADGEIELVQADYSSSFFFVFLQMCVTGKAISHCAMLKKWQLHRQNF